MTCKYQKNTYCPKQCNNNDTWCHFDVDCFYYSENEVGVSDATKEHGGLPPVREWNAHEPEADSQIASEHGAFRNRIDSGSFYCQVNDLDETFGSPSDIKCRKQCVECRAIETKES